MHTPSDHHDHAMHTGCDKHEHDMLHPQVPAVLPVVGRAKESEHMASLFFPVPKSRRGQNRPVPSFDLSTYGAGQFIMVWLPGIDEKPYVVSYLGPNRFGITILERGEFSTALCGLEEGSRVGFRGPYGRGFWDTDRDGGAVLIGGGCGMATLGVLKHRLPDATLVQGAATERDVIFTTRFPNQIIYTEDGSMGCRGLPTDWLEDAVQDDAVDRVYVCGPELMTVRVLDICRRAGVPCQASVERYMKCGIGVCGQCEIDGRLACKDGPVFSAEELGRLPSFGKITRDKSGAPIPVNPDSDEPAPGSSCK